MQRCSAEGAARAFRGLPEASLALLLFLILPPRPPLPPLLLLLLLLPPAPGRICPALLLWISLVAFFWFFVRLLPCEAAADQDIAHLAEFAGLQADIFAKFRE